MSILLRIDHVSKNFGGLRALHDVSFEVNEGEIVGLIGPNGAGKTTLFNCISCFCKVSSGRVFLGKNETTGLTPDKIARLGIARTFQIVKPLKDMSVLDNVLVGALIKTSHVGQARRWARELCDFGGLGAKADQLAQKLTIADKKRLEILKALAIRPKLLLLDETMAGLNPSERQEAVEFVKKINKEMKITILMIEHVMDIIMPLSSHVVVLDYGVKIAEGPPQVIAHDEKVIKAYLGERYHAKVASS
ncbi:MAG: ABC transporter ATP-binding protein [Bacillota bacterium]